MTNEEYITCVAHNVSRRSGAIGIEKTGEVLDALYDLSSDKDLSLGDFKCEVWFTI
jgi:hypothetical protein